MPKAPWLHRILRLPENSLPQIETALPILRYAFRQEKRLSKTDLFFRTPGAYQAFSLPAILLPLVGQKGERLPLSSLQEELRKRSQANHPLLLREAEILSSAKDEERQQTPAAWIQGLSAQESASLQRDLALEEGLFLDADERVTSLTGGSPFAFLHPLPRIVSYKRSRIADNTDAPLSMDALLHRFVHRFSKDQTRTLAQIAVATAYLYQRGFQRLLALLEKPNIRTIRLLFSGQGEKRTLELLQSVFLDPLDGEEGPEIPSKFWEAVETERLQVRVYPHTFLHAKLYLGWDGTTDDGYPDGHAVLGSSNLTGPGMDAAGNLELNLSIEDRHSLKDLMDWFEARWEEAETIRPELLDALEIRKPPPEPPHFHTPGLFDLWKAGQRHRFQPPSDYLAWLASFYQDDLRPFRLHSDLPAYPPDPNRLISPAPEQESGVFAVALRLSLYRQAFLADSVGLGKTITALGTAWYLASAGEIEKAALIAPRKLFHQWQTDRERLRMPKAFVVEVNRHILERKRDADFDALLQGCDLLIVEEAHEILRSRTNQLWLKLRSYLKRHPRTRLLLISATPWNNRREDIFNYLLLGWQDAEFLQKHYPALLEPQAREWLSLFRSSSSRSAKVFEELDLARYRSIFSTVFVQRTRHRIAQLYKQRLDFPRREIHPHTLPPQPAYDNFFDSLAQTIPLLQIPYRDPFTTIQDTWLSLSSPPSPPPKSSKSPKSPKSPKSKPPSEPPPPPPKPNTNLHKGFLIRLYKRAESSLFALAISLQRIAAKLQGMETALQNFLSSSNPAKDLTAWLREEAKRLGRIEDTDCPNDIDDPQTDPPLREPTRLEELLSSLSAASSSDISALCRTLLDQSICPDLQKIRDLQSRLTPALEEGSPKSVFLQTQIQSTRTLQRKLLFIGGYADTAFWTFLLAIKTAPDARIALVLGGDEGWLYDPKSCVPCSFTHDDWKAALSMTGEQMRKAFLHVPPLSNDPRPRALPRLRADLLAAFAPKAKNFDHDDLLGLGGEIDLLIGSEAISLGQNLQDATSLIHLDLPWNPMVLEQRIGRIDRRGGGRPETPGDPDSPTLVDIFYCWSSSVIDKEITLRKRLTDRVQGALQDTDFDEILLHELSEIIQKLRASSSPSASTENQRLAAFLRDRQRELAEQQCRPSELAGASGSKLEALRHLALWLQEASLGGSASKPPQGVGNPLTPGSLDSAATSSRLPPSVIAVGLPSDSLPPGSWLLTVSLQPLRRDQAPLGSPILEHLLWPAHSASPQDDLESLVLALRSAQPPYPPSPLGSSPAWLAVCKSLDLRLQAYQASRLSSHNQPLLSPPPVPSKRPPRSPLQTFRGLCFDAKKSLETELNSPFYNLPEQTPIIDAIEAKLSFLLDLLDAENNHRLYQESDDSGEMEVALESIRAFPRRFLTTDFEAVFAPLAGSLWEDQQTPSSSPSVPLPLPFSHDGLWDGLRLSLVAAAYVP